MIVDPKKVIVLNEKVLIKGIEFDHKTQGGIVLPKSSMKMANLLAEVIAVGSGYRNADGSINKLKVKVGDIVVIPPVKSEPFLVEANADTEEGVDKYYILGEQSILAIVKK